MPLTGVNHQSPVSADLAVGGGAIWVRIQDKVFERTEQH
jgi:hypothetical protein